MKYDFDSVVDRAGTGSLKWDFSRRFTGLPGLLPLWVADMDFPVPLEIGEAIQRRVDHGIFGYTLEPESYFEAAAGWLARRHGWKVEREWMLASPGVIPVLSAAILALTEPGDGIVIQPPVYHPFALRVAANGRRVVENPLLLSGGRWHMDLDGLARAIDGRTRMLILCSPHNPVCRVWGRQELARLAGICADKGVLILSDEIHHDLLAGGLRHAPIASLSEEAARISVTLTAATKTFNLAGLGGSITIVPDPGLRKKLDALQHALFSGVANAVAIAAAEAAWRHGDQWLDGLRAYVDGNHAFAADYLARRLPAVSAAPREATYLAWLDMRGLGLSDDEVIRKLREEGSLWLDEGRKFGRGGQGFQRLNLACPRATLADAMERMARALKPREGGRA